MNEEDLKIPEGRFQKRIKRESALITFGFHAAVLALLTFATCAAPTEPEEELTEITWGGSGGSPEVDAPAGPTMRGTPAPAPRPAERPQPRPEPEKIKTPKAISPSPEKIPAPAKEPVKRPSAPAVQPSTETPKAPQTPSTPSNERPSNQPSGPAGGEIDGTGKRPAGGGGGKSSGYSLSGLGTRKMIVGAGARYPEGSSATGTVTLRFTVMPNGTITQITAVKRAAPELVNAALAGLRKAKFSPLPPTALQESQPGTITYRFELQ